ncbi:MULTISPECIES: M42 family metallopeptidase [Methanobacterium]|jgi:endoglucanase|uniref:M42 family metallopeptidase n=1 Tax=Methanobacterium subterraneum TaxID=59277 RepID=A0A2H4VND6_9EURY|nr:MULTISPECIES: M42 family metallopeptidase [Methanobacterium]MBW4257294.1 M42 family metallopeptidase [Methanobacterium sp. YSL]AUB56523.1 peptidase M42 [Methanobacterium subterraneum]AUB58609.1 peptidase M42 [Methanobacterium sp. MZ-A1]AUB59611.1 peptidase M42 [Methanobacterium subterraneum]MCC7558971.1 M42 family metallopeptidase [Methanobacterium sp.]
MKQILEKLSNAYGVSGFEDDVRNLMMEELKGHVDDLDVDNMGNLIATKKGKPDGKKVMLAAHMDEIGLIVRYIDKEGFIKFSKLGGINDQMLLNQEVYIHSNGEKILGVIGSKPPHRMKAAEKKKPVQYENMFIDIGASDKEDAEEMVNVGDPITIKQKFAELKNDLVMGNAMDNRVGCAILLEVMKRARSDATIYGVGTVQEEVGLKGARTAAYRINPDMALALDVTISGDHPGMKEEDAPAKAGEGPCIILTDASGRGIITHPQVKELLIQVADEEEIPYQLEVSEGGTTDATAIHLTREGIPTGVISPPSRYIHTPVSVVNINDVENAVKLILAVLNRL